MVRFQPLQQMLPFGRQAKLLSGRVLHIRRFGAKFFFLTIVDDGEQIQVMVNFGKLLKKTDPKEFKKMAQLIKRGDHICKSDEPGARRKFVY